jgi:hypothetical protein
MNNRSLVHSSDVGNPCFTGHPFSCLRSHQSAFGNPKSKTHPPGSPSTARKGGRVSQPGKQRVPYYYYRGGATDGSRRTRARGHPPVPLEGRGHRPVPGVPRGAPARRRRLPAGPNPGPSPGHLVSPPVACRWPLGSPPPCARRDGGVCPRVSPPALRRPGPPPLALGPPPVPAGVPIVGGHKALPLALGFGYNPHSL